MKVALPVPFALRFVCQKGFVADSNFVKCSGSSLQTFWKMHSPTVAMMQPKVSVGAPAVIAAVSFRMLKTVMASCKAYAQSLGRHSEKVESWAAGVFPWGTLQVVGGAAFCFE